MGADWQYFDIKVPKELSEEDKLALSEDVIEYIRKRTEANKDNKGKKFPKYSKGYVKSLDFKIARKSEGNVNLTQTGDMLADIETLKIKEGEIRIGFERGSESNAKADGHITGWQGRSETKRPFLGFDSESEKKALADIIKKHVKSDLSDKAELKALAWLGSRFAFKRGKKK